MTFGSLVLENIKEEDNSFFGQENSFDVLREHFKCPICLTTMNSKIFQCVDGHIWCENCAEREKVKFDFSFKLQ